MAFGKQISENELREKVRVFANSSNEFMNQIKMNFNNAYGDNSSKTQSFNFPSGMDGAFLLHPLYSVEESKCVLKIGHYLKSTQHFYIYEDPYYWTRDIRLGYIKEDEKNHIFIFGV